jgi:hypothetical protein
MRNAGAALLLAAAVAAAQETPSELSEVVRAVRERESATYPFKSDYTVLQRGTGEGSFQACFATRHPLRIWRATDRFWLRHGDSYLHAGREPERWVLEWRGTIGRGAPPALEPLPVDFGLEYATERISALLRRPSARILRRERIGEFDCLAVLLDWLQENSESIQHPLGLWLAREHAYFPVQVIHYALAGDPELLEDGAIELSGRRFLPHDWYVVDRLMAVEGALLPGLGRKLPRRRRQELLEFRCNFAEVGDRVVEADFDTPGFMYVLDERRGRHVWITPLVDVPLSTMWFIIYFAWGLAVLVAAHRWRRRRKLRRVESVESVWDTT